MFMYYEGCYERMELYIGAIVSSNEIEHYFKFEIYWFHRMLIYLIYIEYDILVIVSINPRQWGYVFARPVLQIDAK